MNELIKQLKEASDAEKTGICNQVMSLPKKEISRNLAYEMCKVFMNDNHFLANEIDRLENEIGALKIELQQERNARSIEIALVDDEYD